MARKLLGYQIADADGVNIQGDDADPSGEPSFRILNAQEAQAVVEAHEGFLLMPIYEGDIEEPELPPV